MKQPYRLAIFQALLAALLFGASAPLAKLLLGEVPPTLLAALLYLGSGIGMFIFQRLQKAAHSHVAEAQISRTDWPWLLGAILAGGVAAPITLLFSLRSTPAATASLLLNFEGVATTLIAFFAFKEAISRRAWLAIVCIALASILLSIHFGATWGISWGGLGILAACFLWGLDNNFTRHVSSKDPLMIVTAKGLGAGFVSLVIALLIGAPFPRWPIILGAMLLGSLSYGASIALFIHALRELGTARTSALFSTAPLAGVILSVLLFQEYPTLLFLLAVPLMLIGTLLLVNEDHAHEHKHEELTHEHSHNHDDGHHDHVHDHPVLGRHSHVHNHARQVHSHPHMPDLHHRHAHD